MSTLIVKLRQDVRKRVSFHENRLFTLYNIGLEYTLLDETVVYLPVVSVGGVK